MMLQVMNFHKEEMIGYLMQQQEFVGQHFPHQKQRMMINNKSRN